MRFWRPETAIFVGVWGILLLFGPERLFHDPGTLWHVIVGQRILDTHKLIETDSFSFSRSGQPWIAYSWLAECALALVHNVGGLDAILLATATLLAGFFIWIAHRLIGNGFHPLVATLVVALMGMASCYHFHPRPHLLTIVLLGYAFAHLIEFEARRISLGSLFWLVPVFILWANIHGGMLGGLATLLLAVAGWVIAWVSGRDSPVTNGREVILLIALLVGCALTVLVNPFGIRLIQMWLYVINMPVLKVLIAEHAPLLRSGPAGITVLVVGLLYVLALLGYLPKWPRTTWLIPLFWLGAAWTSIRHGPLFAVTATLAFAEFFPETHWARGLTRSRSELFRLRPPVPALAHVLGWRFFVIPCFLVMTAFCLQAARVPVPLLGSGWVPQDSRLPVDLLPDLKAYERAHPEGAPIFNEMQFGGFLIYNCPGLRVFIDDRCELYGADGLMEYAQALVDDPGAIDRWQKQYGFEIALTATGSKFDDYLYSSTDWLVVRRAEAATLYLRKKR
jgi:hypothetical protein